MEFDLSVWHLKPTSRWLVKLVDGRVHAGIITEFNEVEVVLHSANAIMPLASREVDWIRPLIEVGAYGWKVVVGFQAEDTTFDTWWMRDDILLCINYSDPTGFSELVQFISHRDRPEQVTVPWPELLAQVRQQIQQILKARRSLSVVPIAHLQ